MKRYLGATVVAIFTVAFATFVWAQATPQSTVRVSGADSMFGRMRVLSKVFTNANPAIKVDIIEGETVDVGVNALLEGKADIAMASRELLPKEDEKAAKKGLELVERLIGYGGVVIVVNPANPVKSLSVGQVRKILTGDISRWDEVGGRNEFISVVRIDETHPGTLIFMVDDFLQGKSFTNKAAMVSSFPAVMNKVATTPSAIGFVRIRDAIESPIAKKAPVKIVDIKKTAGLAAVAPSRTTVADGSYPIRRPYYLFYTKKASGDVAKFADFLVSKGWGGQDL